MVTWLAYLSIPSLVVAIIALFLNWNTYRRNGQWREQDDAKKLIDTVTRLAATTQTLVDSSAATARTLERLEESVREHDTRLAAGEERFKGLANKADIAKLEGEIAGVNRFCEATAAAVIRIERHLMGEK